MICTPLVLALSIGSVHFHSERHYNDINPGISATCGKWESGYYYNSLKRDSFYVDYRFKYVLAGIVTGYLQSPAPELAFYKDIGAAEVIVMGYPEFDNNKHIYNYGVVVGLKIRWEIK